MALLTAQPVVYTGLTPSYAAVNSTDTFAPGMDLLLHVKNTNAATRTITVTVYKDLGGLALADVGPVTIAATTGEEMLGPFPAHIFADPATGFCTVTYSATAGVTAALIQLAAPAGF